MKKDFQSARSRDRAPSPRRSRGTAPGPSRGRARRCPPGRQDDARPHGQLLNASRLGQSLDLSHPTVRSYLGYLEGAFLIRLLPPYAANVRKRLVRSPKLYWRDSGLLHALLRVRSYDDLLVQPWVGASWEGFVIEQILSTLAALGVAAEAHFVRTSDGYEADLLLEVGRERWAFEIKLTSQPEPRDLQRLDAIADLLRAGRRIMVSQTRESTFAGKRASCSLADLLSRLRERGTP